MSLTVWAGAPIPLFVSAATGWGAVSAFPDLSLKKRGHNLFGIMAPSEGRYKSGNVLLSHQAPLAVPSAP